MTTSINVKELYFEFQELTPLNGEPTFDTLQKILTQLKSNASSVPTNLGGSGHGLIGAILSTASYATLAPLTPFQGPTHPGTLTVPPNSTQYVISLLKTQYSDAMRSYHLNLIFQCFLIQQILVAIEIKYLTLLRNMLSSQVPNGIWVLLF